MTGLYIHVPFCEKRCSYCSFYSTTHGKQERGLFLRSLIEEMRQRKTTDEIATLYFGGGTPSQLDAEEMEQLFEALHLNFHFSSQAEITFETNPDDLTLEKAIQLKKLGINRLSMGVQSFDDRVLHIINRRHNAQQALDAIALAHQVGIDNVSIDLIYGLPEQCQEQWERDLKIALSQPVQHLSAYSLMYEEGTALYRQLKAGKITPCDEEVSLSMFERLIEASRQVGFEQYEISNFALPGFHSQHNSSYWTGQAYIGLGPSAHSYDGKKQRRHNTHSLLQYIRAYDKREQENWDVPHEVETLTDNEAYNEIILTRLRTMRGLPLSVLAPDRRAYVDKMAAPYLKNGWLRLAQADEEVFLQLTHQGIFRSDHITADLMWEE